MMRDRKSTTVKFKMNLVYREHRNLKMLSFSGNSLYKMLFINPKKLVNNEEGD